jgi:hypothetical protein
MSVNKVQEIERAIGALTQQELEELRLWFDQYAGPQPLDTRIQADVASGRLDKAVQKALEEERQGRVQPL